ncbi:LytR C-terminal domain-containing protein [Nesterenkonia ebinurensis]|uniref:LytR C-terminal domain-containing protein n=1 Tax=Nesterenkonia ebinurensis TaxID=2608252 RepID=UPI00123E0AC4|nr:LytR C-terminal domain-containing protein [Nesterenkonia ebinurensis]
MTQFPHDVFDDVQPYRPDEVGKHRALGAKPSGGAAGPAGLGKWIALAAVAVLLIVGASWFFTRDGEEDTAAEDEQQEQTPEETGEDEEEGNGQEDEEEGNGEQGGLPEALGDGHTVRAVNAGAPAGSAGALTSELQELGLEVGDAMDWDFGNWGNPPATPMIYYPSEDQQAQAQAIAEVLEIETVTESADWMTMVVVVGSEYDPDPAE